MKPPFVDRHAVCTLSVGEKLRICGVAEALECEGGWRVENGERGVTVQLKDRLSDTMECSALERNTYCRLSMVRQLAAAHHGNFRAKQIWASH